MWLRNLLAWVVQFLVLVWHSDTLYVLKFAIRSENGNIKRSVMKPGPSQCYYHRYLPSTIMPLKPIRIKTGQCRKEWQMIEETPQYIFISGKIKFLTHLSIDRSELSLQYECFRVNSMPPFGSTSFIWKLFVGVVLLVSCSYLKLTRVMKRRNIYEKL